MTPAVVVIAKAPVAGRSKTRLCPPCSPAQAAMLAEGALRDTLDAVADCSAPRRVIALDGEPGDWLPEGFEVIPQRGEGLSGRLAAVTEDVGGPLLIVGMDTPQLTPRSLDSALATLEKTDAVLGPAPDGGYWAIGLAETRPAVFHDVPMSADDTLRVQRRRLAELGLDCIDLEILRDVDTFEDAVAVAASGGAPAFTKALAGISSDLGARA